MEGHESPTEESKPNELLIRDMSQRSPFGRIIWLCHAGPTGMDKAWNDRGQ